MKKVKGTAHAWESGELGTNPATVRVAGPEAERAIDEALGLQMISIRLPVKMVEAYKHMAAFHGMGYQPLMREILQCYVPHGLKEVLDHHQMLVEQAKERAKSEAEKYDQPPMKKAA